MMSQSINDILNSYFELLEKKLPSIQQQVLTVPGVIKSIRDRGALSCAGETIQASYQSDLPPAIFLSKILNFDEVVISDANLTRQLGPLSKEDVKKLIDFKINHFISTTSMISLPLKDKILPELPKLEAAVAKLLQQTDKKYFTHQELHAVKSVVEGFLKQFGFSSKSKTLEALKNSLANQICINNLDIVLDALLFSLGDAKVNYSDETKQLIWEIQQSTQPVELIKNSQLETLDERCFMFASEELEQLGIDLNDFKSRFQEKVNSITLESIKAAQTLVDSSKDPSYERQILPLLSIEAKNKGLSDTRLCSPEDYFKTLNDPYPGRPYQWGLGDANQNQLVAGQHLRALNLLQFLQAEHKKPFFEHLALDVMQTEFYQQLSIDNKIKFLGAYYFNAWGKLMYLYPDKNQGMQKVNALNKAYNEYLTELKSELHSQHNEFLQAYMDLHHPENFNQSFDQTRFYKLCQSLGPNLLQAQLKDIDEPVRRSMQTLIQSTSSDTVFNMELSQAIQNTQDLLNHIGKAIVSETSRQQFKTIALQQFKDLASKFNDKIQASTKLSENHRAFVSKLSRYINQIDANQLSDTQFKQLKVLMMSVKNVYDMDVTTVNQWPDYLNLAIDNISNHFEHYLSGDSHLAIRLQGLQQVAAKKQEYPFTWLKGEAKSKSFTEQYLQSMSYPGLKLGMLAYYDSFRIGSQKLFAEVRTVEKHFLKGIINSLKKYAVNKDLIKDLETYYAKDKPSQEDYQKCLSAFESALNTLPTESKSMSLFARLKRVLLTCFGVFQAEEKPLQDLLKEQKQYFEELHPHYQQLKK